MAEEPLIYTDRREFLLASTSDTRDRFRMKLGDHEYFGFASTPLQFFRAVTDLVLLGPKKLSRDELHSMMADELKAMEAETG